MKKLEQVRFSEISFMNHDEDWYYGVHAWQGGTTLYREYKRSTNPIRETLNAFGSSVGIEGIFIPWTKTITGQYIKQEHKGLVFVSAKDYGTTVDRTNKYYLWRSTDYGATFTQVYMFGDIDGTEVNQVAGVSILGSSYAYDPVRDIHYIADYNIASGRTPGDTSATGKDKCQFMQSSDSGATWTNLVKFNNGTHLLRHWHCFEYNPHNGHFIIAGGDGDPSPVIIDWDGTSPWQNDLTSWAAYNALTGITALSGDQTYRAVDIVFTADYLYYISDVYEAQGTNGHGIFRFNHDLSNEVRVFDPTGILTDKATGIQGDLWGDKLVFVAGPTGPSATTDDNRMPLLIADVNDDTNWTVLHVSQGQNDTNDKLPHLCIADGDTLMFRHNRTAGNRRTTETNPNFGGVYKFSDDDFVTTESIYPMYWVDPVNGVDGSSIEGFSKDTAWKTLAHAMNAGAGDGITYGARIMLMDGVHDLTTVTLDINSHPLPANTSDRMIIEGENPGKAFIRAAGSITIQAGDGDIEFRKCKVISGTLTTSSGYDGTLTENVNVGNKAYWR